MKEAYAHHGKAQQVVANAPVGRMAAAPLIDRARYPCSAGQRRLWVLDQIDPGTPALNIAVRWRLEGRVSAADLGRACTWLIARHPLLRTAIVEEDGEPVQVIAPVLSFHVPVLDLTGLRESEALAEAERIAHLEARASFDLTTPPLIRVTLLRLRDHASIVLLTTHHIVCDRRSVEILVREMGIACAAFGAGRVPALPAPILGYAEYAARQARRLPRTLLQRDEAYWKDALCGFRHFDLPADHARPPLQTTNGGLVALPLGAGLARGLQDIARRHGASLFETALAALFVLLHRYSNERDITLGCTVDNRGERALADVVGPYNDTHVLRARITGDPGYSTLLGQVRETVAAANAHGSTSLNRLIELLAPKRDLSRHALFSINFVYREAGIGEGWPAGLGQGGLSPCCAGALYDLNLILHLSADDGQLSCEYNSDLFEPETATRLLGHFANLLRAVAADPAQKLSAMPMLDEAEQHLLVMDWNRTDAAYPGHMTVPGLFEDQVMRTPDAVAVVCGEQSLSYRELDLASNRLAHELRSRGIGRTSRVGICLDRSPDLMVALMAVLKSGAAYVPLDPAYPPARLAQIVEDARPAVVLTKLAVREHLPEDMAAVILLDAEAVVISGQPDAPLQSATGSDVPAGDDVAYVIYTSGSTGRPKGVQIQHRALTNFLCAMRERPGLSAADTLVAVTTVSFDIAVLELFLPLVVGARVVIAQGDESADGDALLRLLRRHQATIMQATPVTWHLLLAAGMGVTSPPLRMLCGGEAMPRTLADRLLQCGSELWNMYGPTETTVWSSVLRVEAGTGAVLLGPPIANTQFHVLDRNGQLAPTGVPGELFIGGDGVALGYLNLPDMTAERFVPDPFRKAPGARLYRTGDQVRRRAQGTLEYLGRNDHQIKLRGFRIELGEIESVLRAQPQVSDCVVVACVDASGEAAIHAYVVVRDPAGQSPELVSSLHHSLRQALPGYMCPSAIVVLDCLPRTPSGKVDRAALPEPALMSGKTGEPARPLNEMEYRLARIWSAVLGHDVIQATEIEPDANFFEVGGHSLLAMRLLVRIETEFGPRLSLAALFKAPTLAGQASLLEQAQAGDPRAFDFRQVLKLQPNGSRPPLIAINNTGNYYLLSKRLGPDQPFTSLQLFDPALPQAALPRTLEEIAVGYVDLIRRMQPTGPYVLLGWCVAGTLAFEVARQLTTAGQIVSRLILFDTQAPGYLQRLPWLRSLLADYSYRWQLIGADWRRARLGSPGLLAALVAFLANRMVVKKLQGIFVPSPAQPPPPDATMAAHGQWLSPEQYDQWLLRYLENAAASYQPRPFAGAVTLFRSSQEPAGRFLDPQMGWGEFVADGVEVVVIEGDHFSIFQEHGVSQMAQCIETAVMGAGMPQLPS